MVSTFFAVAYVGLGLPAVLTGLISVAVGPVDASAYVSGLVAAIVLVALVVVLRAFGPATTAGTTPVACDSWCQPGESAEAGGRAAGHRPAR